MATVKVFRADSRQYVCYTALFRIVLLLDLPVFLLANASPVQAQSGSHQPGPHKKVLKDQLPDGAVLQLGDPGLFQEDVVETIAFSPNGKIVASGGGYPRTAYRRRRNTALPAPDIYLWDVESGKLIKRLRGHTAGVSSLAYSPNGRFLISGGRDGTVRLWATDSQRPIWSSEATRTLPDIDCVAISPNSKHVAASGPGGIVRMWEAESGEHVRDIDTGIPYVNRIAYDRERSLLLAFGRDASQRAWQLRAWDVEASKLLWEDAGGERQTQAEFSLAASLVLVAEPNGSVVLRRLLDGGIVGTFKTGIATANSLNEFAFSPDGRTLAHRVGDVVSVRNVETTKVVSTLRLSSHYRCPSLSPDGKHVALCVNRHVVVADMDRKQVVWPKVGHPGGIGQIRISADGSTIVTAGRFDKMLRVWGADTGRLDGEIAFDVTDTSVLPSESAFALSPNGKLLIASQSYGAPFRVLRIPSGEHVDVSLPVASRTVAAEFVSASEVVVITTFGKIFSVLPETAVTRQIGDLKSKHEIMAASFSEEGGRVAVLNDQQHIAVMDIVEGKTVWSKTVDSLNVLRPIVLSIGAQVLGTRLDRRVAGPLPDVTGDFPLILWSATSGEELERFSGDYVDLAVSGNSTRLLATCDTEQIRVATIPDGKVQARFANVHGATLLELSSNTRFVLSAGWQGTSFVWRLSID